MLYVGSVAISVLVMKRLKCVGYTNDCETCGEYGICTDCHSMDVIDADFL